jgi:AraC-like DNA-binding protein
VVLYLEELGQRITRLAGDSSGPTWIDDVMVFATGEMSESLGTVTEPMLALVVQGAKRTALGDVVLEHRAGQVAVATVALPLAGRIIQASRKEPFLALGLRLRPSMIAQLLVDGRPPAIRPHDGPGIAISDADETLLDAFVRLMRLLEKPDDLRVLGDGVRREIHWRLLNGPQGAMIRQAGAADSQLALVARAIAWIRTHFDQVIRVDELASHVGVSVSSLNRHFRAVTAMSPIQFQKQIRLQHARIQLITAPSDVAAVGYAVGYENPSQFSREYRRMYGAPPGQDALRLQTMAIVQE